MMMIRYLRRKNYPRWRALVRNENRKEATKKISETCRYVNTAKKKLVPGAPVFGQALLAVHRPSLGGLERYFTFLSAV